MPFFRERGSTSSCEWPMRSALSGSAAWRPTILIWRREASAARGGRLGRGCWKVSFWDIKFPHFARPRGTSGLTEEEALDASVAVAPQVPTASVGWLQGLTKHSLAEELQKRYGFFWKGWTRLRGATLSSGLKMWTTGMHVAHVKGRASSLFLRPSIAKATKRV